MIACIILNGKITDYNKIKDEIVSKKYDVIICADGGTNHIKKMGIMPDYIVGDLDSIEKELVIYYKNNNVKFKEFPTKKDYTDTEISIYLAKTLCAKEIHLYGALGGRIDHCMANIGLMSYIKKQHIKPTIISETEDIFICMNEEIYIKGNKDDIISIIPIGGDAKGVTLKGLEYELDNKTLRFDEAMGISNVLLNQKCLISTMDGILIIIRNK